METNQTKKRLHPLVAGAAVSVMLVSIVGVAAIMGFLPQSHSTAAPTASTAPAIVQPAAGNSVTAAPAPVAHNKAATHHSEPVHSQTASTAQYGQPSPNHSQPAQQAAQQPAAAQNSYVGMAAGTVVGGVLGNQVGHGTGKALATAAGAVGGGYVGNEIGKRVP